MNRARGSFVCFVIGVCLVLGATGCHRKPPATEPPAREPAPAPAPAESTPAESAEPEKPQLLTDTAEVDRDALLERIARVEQDVSGIEEDELSEESLERLTYARTFLDEARSALERGDLQRASVLLDKATVLLRELTSEAEDSSAQSGTAV